MIRTACTKTRARGRKEKRRQKGKYHLWMKVNFKMGCKMEAERKYICIKHTRTSPEEGHQVVVHVCPTFRTAKYLSPAILHGTSADDIAAYVCNDGLYIYIYIYSTFYRFKKPYSGCSFISVNAIFLWVAIVVAAQQNGKRSSSLTSHMRTLVPEIYWHCNGGNAGIAFNAFQINLK